MIAQEITFLPRQSKVIVNIPILDDTISKESDIYFFICIIFNKHPVAQSVITIVDNDHGECNALLSNTVMFYRTYP